MLNNYVMIYTRKKIKCKRDMKSSNSDKDGVGEHSVCLCVCMSVCLYVCMSVL